MNTATNAGAVPSLGNFPVVDNAACAPSNDGIRAPTYNMINPTKNSTVTAVDITWRTLRSRTKYDMKMALPSISGAKHTPIMQFAPHCRFINASMQGALNA